MKNATWRIGLAVAVFALIVGATGQARADLVVNGGFETGDLTGWTTTGNSGPDYVAGNIIAYSGSYGFAYGQVGSLGFLSQTIATQAGQTYTFEFFQNTMGGTPNEFSASFDGHQLLDLVNSPFSGIFTQYDFTVVASTASTVISFGLRQDLSFSALDDVSVNPSGVSVVPEPSTFASACMAVLAGLGFAWRRRKQSATA